VAFAVLMIVAAGSRAQQLKPGWPNEDAKACRLLPVAMLEARWGGKVERLLGVDATSAREASWCKGIVKDKLYIIRNGGPDSEGMAKSKPAMLESFEAYREMTGPYELKDYGAIVCRMQKYPNDRKGNPLPTPRTATDCYLFDEGRMHLYVDADGPGGAPFDEVKLLLELASKNR
jgi:hypothetical protein